MAVNGTELRLSKFIKANREKVFAAWTEIDHIRKWFCPVSMTVPFAEVDARLNGRYKITMQNSKDETFTTYGEYQEFVPNEKLVFTWGWEGPDRHETLVTVEFFDKDGGTEVQLTHTRFADVGQAEHHEEGWVGCLDNLLAHLSS